MGETRQAFSAWFVEASARFGAPPVASTAWNAALLWAADQIEAAGWGCNCDGRQFARPAEMKDQHWPDCPVALTEKIRSELLLVQQTPPPGEWELVYHRMT